MRIGLISDPFTQVAFEYEDAIELILLSPKYWRLQLLTSQIDILFVESCWQGYQGLWKHKVANYRDRDRDLTLSKITAYCKRKKILTVFWNKEDPIHYNRFCHNLSLFDVCLTTEASLISQYKRQFIHLKSVELLPFFFQPKIHNPEMGERIKELDNRILFCGGLYQQEFPERAERLKMVAKGLNKQKLVVFDRFTEGHNGWGNSSQIERWESFIYTDSKKHYQSGRLHINVNTCDGSKTMYSRRLIELLACQASVIDITKFKKNGVLSTFVQQVSTEKEFQSAILKEAPHPDYQYLKDNYSVSCVVKMLQNFLN